KALLVGLKGFREPGHNLAMSMVDRADLNGDRPAFITPVCSAISRHTLNHAERLAFQFSGHSGSSFIRGMSPPGCKTQDVSPKVTPFNKTSVEPVLRAEGSA